MSTIEINVNPVGIEVNNTATGVDVAVAPSAFLITYDASQGPKGEKGDTGDIGLVWSDSWTTALTYTATEAVTHNNSLYYCTATHIADASTEPGVGGSWTSVWDVMVESPLYSSNNVWTGTNTFNNTVYTNANVIGTAQFQITNDYPLYLKSNTPFSTSAWSMPTLEIWRDTDQAGDELGGVAIYGQDSAANLKGYGYLYGKIVDPTFGSHDGQLIFGTFQNSSSGSRMTIGAGVQVGAPTGGDMGANTLNATTLYQGGVEVMSNFAFATATLTDNLTVTTAYHLILSAFDLTTTDKTASLPAASSATGYTFGFQLRGTSTAKLIIDCAGADTFKDGWATRELHTEGDTIWIYSDGTNWQIMHKAIEHRQIVFTSSGTWNPTPGCTAYRVEAVGGGGSAGATSAPGGSAVAYSTPGGAGAYVDTGIAPLPSASTTGTVTVGAGGTSGGAGGDTIWSDGTYDFTCLGGLGSTGGTTTIVPLTTVYNPPRTVTSTTPFPNQWSTGGTSGGPVWLSSLTQVNSGPGGSSHLGAGGRGMVNDSAAYLSTPGWGGGAGGNAVRASGAAQTAVAGGAGILWVWEYF